MTRDERLTRLENNMRHTRELLSRLAGQIAEQNLRVRFIMDWFNFEKKIPSGVIGADGHPLTTPVRMTLLDIYTGGGREQLLLKLEKEVRDAITEARAFTDPGAVPLADPPDSPSDDPAAGDSPPPAPGNPAERSATDRRPKATTH